VDQLRWRLGRRPALDGLRGLAILLVLLSHLLSLTHTHGDRFWAVGSAGVTVFFALSGFLITSLLIEEHAREGRVSLRRFYERRARRLFPALAVVIGAVALLQHVVPVPLMPSLWAVFLYVGNWVDAFGGNLGLLNPTWSLAIEEQFYLVWPLVLLGSLRWRRGPLLVVVVGIVISTSERFVLWSTAGGPRVYNGSDTQAATLLIGCLLALLAQRGLREWNAPRWVVPLTACALFGLVLVPGPWASDVLVPTVVPWVSAVLIWLACSRPGGLLASDWLRYLGRRSYAIYLWHLPVLWVVLEAADRNLVCGVLALLLTVGIAEGSWRLIESPFLARAVGRRAELREPALSTD
jgi:peptidoglycan/LPS O-acetylase OafA/YrhL